MYHFFVEPDQIFEKEAVIVGPDVNHIKNVLRLKIGEELSLSNGIDENEYRVAIKEFTDDEVRCELRFIKEADVELPSKIYLFQGLPKGDKMELIIQKAVELGVYEVIPVAMSRCVVKLDAKKAEAKVKRWNGIAEAAAKQSKRGVIPQVHGVLSYKEALAYANDIDVKLLPYEMAEGMGKTKELIESIKPGESVAVFIGPEGGFGEDEVKLTVEKGFESITLGKRILRTETAGMTTLSILMYHLENNE